RRASDLIKESLRLFQELRDKWGIINCLIAAAGLAAGWEGMHTARGAKRAATLLGAAEGLLREIGAVLEAADLGEYERNVVAARAQLGRVAFTRAWTEGRAMSQEDAC